MSELIQSKTGRNNSASRLLGGGQSIGHCSHDSDSFDDRLLLVKVFSVGAVVD